VLDMTQAAWTGRPRGSELYESLGHFSIIRLGSSFADVEDSLLAQLDELPDEPLALLPKWSLGSSYGPFGTGPVMVVIGGLAMRTRDPSSFGRWGRAFLRHSAMSRETAPGTNEAS
jgi:hypothetical protein